MKEFLLGLNPDDNCYSMIKGKELHFIIKLNILIVIISFSIPCMLIASEEEQGSSIIVNGTDTVYHVGLFQQKRAERLFYGLITINKGVRACADCHYLNYIDTLNWNPSAFDIAQSFAGKKVEDLMKVVNEPLGKKMAEVHSGYNITEEQAVLLQAYLEKLNKEDKPYRKPRRTHLLLFILVNIIGLAATIDLLFAHKIRFRAIHLMVILAAAIYVIRIVVIESINIGRQENYAPLQPVKFSHKVHAGNNRIDCEYCHNLAERSKSAGIPPTSLCLNCHSLVVEGTRSGKFEIAKVRNAVEAGTPIRWIKVHNLPDYVFFSHAQHVKVGKLECSECHGPVEEMDVVYQYSDLSMGWCLDCHRTRKVDFEGNAYYSELFEEYHNKLKEGIMDSVLVKDIGGTNCMRCHY